MRDVITRTQRTINRDWSFYYYPLEERNDEFKENGFDDSAWSTVSIPHTWNTYETTGSLHPFIRDAAEADDPYWWNGWGYYRKIIFVSSVHRNRKIFLEFDGVQKYSKIWVNGKLAGEHFGGFTSFSVDISSLINFGEKNLIAIQVSNRQNDRFAIPPMNAGNWNVYGGIYRDVRIVITDRLHIPYQGSADHEGGTFISTPEVSAEKTKVNVKTYVRNDYDDEQDCYLKTLIYDENGKLISSMQSDALIEAGGIFEFNQDSETIFNPPLWSSENPVVFRVVSRLLKDGELVDSYQSPLGFRFFHWDYEKKKLILNGKEIHIHGSNRHQEYPWLGDAIPKWIHKTDLQDIRFKLNHNFLRTCHYPQDPMVYDLCDKYGIIVCEEVPNIKSLPFNDDIQQRNVKEMIRRDRNHPSIFMWSLGNETNHAAKEEWALAEDRSRIIHFRHTRGRGENALHTNKQLDMENLLRCNIRGWPEKGCLPPEIKASIDNNEHGQISGTEEWQHHCARIKDASIRGRIDEDIVVWIYADHGANRIYRNCPLKYVNPKGWTDAYRQPKYMYHLWRANYCRKEPVIFIHPHFWQRKFTGLKKNIVVDSNCESLELSVGEKNYGRLFPSKENFHNVTFENVLVEDRTLRVTGIWKDKKIISKYPMPGKAESLSLTVSHDKAFADRSVAALLTADIVDSSGNSVYGASNKIRWHISGSGTLSAPSEYASDLRKLEENEGVFYTVTPVSIPVRTTNRAGRITVEASSPGLKGASVSIDIAGPEGPENDGIIEYPIAEHINRVGKEKVFADKIKNLSMGEEIQIIYNDIHLPESNEADYRRWMRDIMLHSNRNIDVRDEKLIELMDEFVRILVKNKGILIADDYNFMINQYNLKI